MGYTYGYDQLNRMKRMRQYAGIHGASWSKTNVTKNYQENATYDGNGNILTYGRNGAAPTAQTIDSLTYNYSHNVNNRLVSNKLQNINDAVASSNYSLDIRNQSNPTNYRYDAIGDLIYDAQSNITGNDGVNAITWSVYGKIQSIYKTTGAISYTYDPAGERVSKTANGLTTWYVRDAQGNTLAVYNNAHSLMNWREQDLYGSSRLGMWLPNINLANNNAQFVADTIGKKVYELNNHLGNVLETVTDKRLQTASGSSVGYYTADVASAQDYYPFGMLQPGRQYTYGSDSTYRYGFNGKENDNEVKGLGNEQDYGKRIYDPRVGRFLSVDPIAKNYSELTPYQFASNSPIANIDLDGEEAKYFTLEQDAKTGKTSLELTKQVNTFTDIGGKTVQYPLQYHVSFKGESYTFFDSGGPYGVIPENTIENFNTWRGTNLPFDDIFYSDNEAWGRLEDEMVNEWAVGLAMAYSMSGTGSIYQVPGEYTPSGDPYVGRNNTTDPATNRSSDDGRDRTKLKKIGMYDADDVQEGQYKEQKAMDQRGTPRKTLDNKRREVSLKRMKVLEAKYGGGKKTVPILLPKRKPVAHPLPKSKSLQKKDQEEKRETSDLLINHG